MNGKQTANEIRQKPDFRSSFYHLLCFFFSCPPIQFYDSISNVRTCMKLTQQVFSKYLYIVYVILFASTLHCQRVCVCVCFCTISQVDMQPFGKYHLNLTIAVFRSPKRNEERKRKNNTHSHTICMIKSKENKRLM